MTSGLSPLMIMRVKSDSLSDTLELEAVIDKNEYQDINN
jgi:hypothetical protein